jgi:hypothetical protein
MASLTADMSANFNLDSRYRHLLYLMSAQVRGFQLHVGLSSPRCRLGRSSADDSFQQGQSLPRSIHHPVLTATRHLTRRFLTKFRLPSNSQPAPERLFKTSRTCPPSFLI